MAKQTFVNILPGDTAPWFKQRSGRNPQYAFDTAAGRYLVLCFLASASDEHAGQRLRPHAAGPASSTMTPHPSSP
jgi:hypothetical protein